MRFVNTLQEIIARRMREEGQEDQNKTPRPRRGIFGPWSTLPQPLRSLLPGYEPGNPYGASLGDFPNANGYSPPSYGDDLQLAGTQRTPLSNALTSTPPMLPRVNGMGGPEVVSRGMAPPSAPAAPPLAAQENQAFADARARAIAGIQEEGYPYMSSPSWVQSRTQMDRALDADRVARAEQARREGVSFDQWWRFGGRQDPSQRDTNDPAFRFSRPRR